MPSPLENKHIVLGITGSIAAYKGADLASKLTQGGAIVDVILSRGASKFITPLTFRSLTHREVISETFDQNSAMELQHVTLAEMANLVVVAPATAHTIAKLALGLADDAITTIALASRSPMLVAPAMEGHMYENPVVQENLEKLRQRDVHIASPTYGHLASGATGWGRLPETNELLGHIKLVLGIGGDLAGYTMVVSAGGTQEPMDPVRVVTNRSSGKMGFAVAEAGRDRGAKVVLVTAPTAIPDPIGVDVRRISNAHEMQDAVLSACKSADVLIMAAAVADYHPSSVTAQKRKSSSQRWLVEMVKNPDILREAPPHLVKVGFAAETENLQEAATAKLLAKHLDLIVANDVTDPTGGFGSDNNKVLIVDRDGTTEELPLMSKYAVAQRILDRIVVFLANRG